MQGQPLANGTEKHCDWNSIDWMKANRRVRNLRQRIFRATEQGDWRKVKSLQKLMLRSYSNVVTSVRRVSQQNQGKKTPGIDKLIVKTPSERGKLVDELLCLTLWRANPVRRVYIPKSNGKMRPLGIPVIRDRAMQAMVKNVLEPSWEARFERTSYGFRPGRSAHDAMTYIFSVVNPKKKPYVIDADIKGAFDNINHDYLLKTIGDVPGKELIKQWLKAGYVEMGQLHQTDAGTPQGGVISPLLANIALHGLGYLFNIQFRKSCVNKYSLVRYADDFIIFCKTREDAEQGIEKLNGWLSERGLELSSEKTRITTIQDGFDFLGFNVRIFPTKKNKTGWKTLITPSKKSVQKIKDRLKEEWKSLQGQNVAAVLKRLPPIVRGWANYFRHQCSARTFQDLEQYMVQREIAYARRTHINKPKYWWKAKYFGKLPNQKYAWNFGDKSSGYYLTRFDQVHIIRHIMVKGTSSPDDPKLKKYWLDRNRKKTDELKPSLYSLAFQQKGICPICGESLHNDERIETHHITAKHAGGSDTLDNKILIHYLCHQQLTASQRQHGVFRG